MEKLRDIFIIIGVCMIGGFIFNHIYQNEKQSKIEKNACIIVLYNEDYIKDGCDKYFVGEHWYEDFKKDALNWYYKEFNK